MIQRAAEAIGSSPKAYDLPRRTIECCLCGPGAAFRVRYPEHIETGPIDFRARKMPTHQHFRMVECLSCGLVYSNPIIAADVIETFYRDTPFVEETQLDNMLSDYRDQLRDVMPLLPSRSNLLEIGCANGAFLRAALELGFQNVRGVEPGAQAVRQAQPDVQSLIVNDFFRPDLFPSGFFDVVCCFQILDHLLDPVGLLRGANALLRDDGVLLLINHNIRSWFPRLFGRRCPMYDVEHIYLFDPKTIARALQRTGFDVVRVEDMPNSYNLGYALKMFPLPLPAKRRLLNWSKKSGAADYRMRLAAGNMVCVGRKTKST